MEHQIDSVVTALSSVAEPLARREGNKAETMIIPQLLLLVEGLVYACRYCTWRPPRGTDFTDVVGFGMLMSVIQIVPLVVLKAKLMDCPDRISILSRFSLKVLLMYSFMLSYSVSINVLGLDNSSSSGMRVVVNALFAIMLFGILTAVFNVQPSTIFWEHQDVGFLHFLAGALSFSALAHHAPRRALEFFCTDFCNEIEILSFMNAAWIVYQMGENVKFAPIAEQDSQKRAICFFGFLVTFYFWEDIVDPWLAANEETAFRACRLIHWLMLIDFSMFTLSQTYRAGGKSAGQDLDLNGN